eukprot:1154352-Pelagomonas_calceolata.AAC.1
MKFKAVRTCKEPHDTSEPVEIKGHLSCLSERVCPNLASVQISCERNNSKSQSKAFPVQDTNLKLEAQHQLCWFPRHMVLCFWRATSTAEFAKKGLGVKVFQCASLHFGLLSHASELNCTIPRWVSTSSHAFGNPGYLKLHPEIFKQLQGQHGLPAGGPYCP